MLSAPLRLSHFENAVVTALLAGSDDVLSSLRSQIPFLRVTEREHTGCGIYVTLALGHAPADATVSLTLSDLHIEMPTLTYGAAAILYIVDGVVHLLECVTYGNEAWPEKPELRSVQYVQTSGLPMETRDPNYVASLLR